MRRAVIDIGTNSVKLLLAEVTGEVVLPLIEESEQTRLGLGFYPRHQLQPGPVLKTAHAVARFSHLALETGAAGVRVIATSAVREATNQAELLRAVRSASGLDVEVISGEQEADWVYAGVRSDPVFADHALLVLEVGGGSCEFILGEGRHPDFRRIFPLGTVRLAEAVCPGDPPSDKDWETCRSTIEQILDRELGADLPARLEPPKVGPALLVGTGGTASILGAMEHRLAAFDRHRIEHTRLSRDRLRQYQRRLWSLPLSARREIAGLPPNRADVILFGVAIFMLVVEKWCFEEVCVSARGLRCGALLSA